MLDKYNELAQDIIAIKNLSLCFPTARVIYDDTMLIMRMNAHWTILLDTRKKYIQYISGLIETWVEKEYQEELFKYWDSDHVKVALHKLKSDVLTWVQGYSPQLSFVDFKKQQTKNSPSTELWLLYQYLEFNISAE